MLRFMVVLEAI